MEVTLIRGETAGGYAYHLKKGDTLKRLYRGRGYYYIKQSGDKIPVYFNGYLFPQFASIPMRRGVNDYGAGCWQMKHEYRQAAGGASAPYEIIERP